jgi:hypothetical protein
LTWGVTYVIFLTNGDTMMFLLIKDFPEKLHREIKSLAAKEGERLKDYIIKILKVHAGIEDGKAD